jgi:mono/diheme cytochrome c family protein
MIFRKHTIRKILFFSIPALALAVFSSCHSDKVPGYEFMPDMYRSPSYETYSSNPNFSDSMTARVPVKGTIPRGYMVYPYQNNKEGYETAGKELVLDPAMHTAENIAEGKRLFEINCRHCHGDEGKGNGPVIEKGFPPPPSFSGAQLKELPFGKIIHSITYGKNLMGPHASLLTFPERMKVAMYIQKLQKPDEPKADAMPAAEITKKK